MASKATNRRPEGKEETMLRMTALQELERAFGEQIDALSEEDAQRLIDEADGNPSAVNMVSLEKAGGKIVYGRGLPPNHPYA